MAVLGNAFSALLLVSLLPAGEDGESAAAGLAGLLLLLLLRFPCGNRRGGGKAR